MRHSHAKLSRKKNPISAKTPFIFPRASDFPPFRWGRGKHGRKEGGRVWGEGGGVTRRQFVLDYFFSISLLPMTKREKILISFFFSFAIGDLWLFRGAAQWVEWVRNRRIEYWAIRSSTCLFARTTHSFACSALLALLVRSTTLICVLIRSLTRSQAQRKEVFVQVSVHVSDRFNPLWADMAEA